jgi:hypothetical protein
VKLAAVGVRLATHLCPAHVASVVVLVAVWEEQEERLPHRVRLLAAGAEETRRLKLPETVYHVGILDPEGPPRSSSQAGGSMASASELDPIGTQARDQDLPTPGTSSR